MNWIVTWVIITTFAVSCPEQNPIQDEFGVIQPNTTSLLVACYDTTRKSMQKEFATKEEAEVFITEGKKKYSEEPLNIRATARDWKLLKICR